MILKYLAVFAVSYVIGSLSLSIIVSGGLFGKDIRSFGSGNAGATNMARVFGWSAGILTLVGDAAKAVLCMVLGNLWLGDMGLAIAAFGWRQGCFCCCPPLSVCLCSALPCRGNGRWCCISAWPWPDWCCSSLFSAWPCSS